MTRTRHPTAETLKEWSDQPSLWASGPL